MTVATSRGFARRAILVAGLVALASGTAIAALRVAHDIPASNVAPGGIVAPFAAWLAVSSRAVSLAAWLGAALLALVVAAASRTADAGHAGAAWATPTRYAWLWRTRPWQAVLSLVVLLGVLARTHVAAWSRWDIDEPWAFPSSGTLFDDSHDALVHPPLYRALALGWDELIGWTLHEARWLLRLPSLVAGCVALALLAWLALPRPSPRATIGVLLGAVASAAIAASGLARPYALASLAVMLVVVVLLDSFARPLSPFEGAICVFATTVAAWTDLIAGVAVCLAIGTRCVVDLRAGRSRFAVLFAGCAALPLVPLLPGAWLAWRTGIDPATSLVPGALPDLLPAPDSSFVSRAYVLLGALSEPFPAPSAVVALCALVGVAWYRRARAPATLLALLCALPLALLPSIELRARHFAWLPLVAAAVLVVVPQPLPKRAA